VVKKAEQQRFDALLERVMAALPRHIHDLIEEAPVIVEDRPSAELLEEMGMDPEEESLCGLQAGTPMTERTVGFDLEEPTTIYLFREGIVEHAGGWERWKDEDGQWWGGEQAVEEEIRITLLHEIGHHYGLEEDDLEELGYE
jgi:predicted Zn-dependent protease with MMP-like domain